MKPTRVYRLDVTYPPGSQEIGWEPPDWQPAYTAGIDPDADYFRWPANRLCLSVSTANRRAALFRKYGATVTVVSSLPIEWPEVTP